MENRASIDDIYKRIERGERQRNRLALLVAGISISSLFGLAINAVSYISLSNTKGAFDNISSIIILLGIIFVVSIILAGLAVKNFIALKKLNRKLVVIGNLEETIYKEVLKSHLDQI